MKIRKLGICLLLTFSQVLFAQINNYTYERLLNFPENKWYSIVLPDEMFEKVSPDFSDIRVFAIVNNNSKKADTIETPYVIRTSEGTIIEKKSAFKLLNQSKNDKGYYFTFETPVKTEVNQLKLNFKQQNFDWNLVLEGSQDQQEWFSIVADYRILSIKNEATDFNYSTVNFPPSNYKYYRITLKSDVKPELSDATLLFHEHKNAYLKDHLLFAGKPAEEKRKKQTILNFALPTTIPLSYLKININEKVDYYRNFTIEYLVDSVKTGKGWIYNYNKLTSGTLNSINENLFGFNSTFLRKFRIIIDDQDNQPLHINSVLASSYVYQLYTRISTVPATYYLVYGNKQAVKPAYDLDHFIDKIPQELAKAALGPELFIKKTPRQTVAPLFENKAWLWTLMVVLIIVLGVFSFKMMRKNNA
jgi:hypothetical protein